MVCNHLTKFSCSRKYMFLVCHVIKQDQVIKVSSKLWPVKATHYPTKLVAISTLVVEI